MRLVQVIAAVIASVLALAVAPVDTAGAQQAEVVDRIVAVVDGEIITLGHLRRSINLMQSDFNIDTGVCLPLPPLDTADPLADAELARLVLGCEIDELLAFRHVRRFPQFDVLRDDIDAAYLALMEAFGGRAAFEEALETAALTAAEVRYDIERQALIGNYVRIRYADIVDISDSEIRNHYDEVVLAEAARAGEEPPPLEAVEQLIEATLGVAEFNRRVEGWIADLRRRADIVVYLW